MKRIKLASITLLLAIFIAACGGGGGGSSDGGGTSGSGGGSTTTYTIGGTVTGLSGTGLVLQNNGGDNLSVAGNGNFTFNTSMASSSAYAVTVLAQPIGPAQSCNVLRNGSGTISSAHVINVVVDCSAARFAYIPNVYDNTLSIYTIDAATGRLRHNGYITTDTGPRSVAVDPSGKYLYLISFYSFTIKAYAINASNGALTLVNSLSTGTNPISVTVDSSGKFVYVANANSDNVSAYSINTSTGALTDVGAYNAGNEPLSVTVNPTGQYLYVANQNSSGTGSVSVFSINTSTGVLSVADADGSTAGTQATIAAGTWPQTVILDSSGKFAYVPNWNSNNISAYRVDAGSGSLTPVDTVSSIGTGPTALAIDASGQFAYVSNQTSSNVSVFSINSTTGELDSVDADAVTGGTQTTIAADTAPLSVSVDITGKYVYVANMGANNLSAYSINAATGALTALAKMATRSGPISIAMANGATQATYTPKFAYAANAGGGNVSQYTIGVGGSLTSMAAATVTAGSQPRSVTVDRPGRFVYAANYVSNNISAYTVNQITGELTEVAGSPYPAGTSPTAVRVDPSGKFVYASNYGWPGIGSVSAYTINPVTGALTPIAGSPFAAGNGSSSIAIEPSGRFVYASNLLSDTLTAFSINIANGVLSRIDADAVTGGIQDLVVINARPVSITVDPTGRFTYIATACGTVWAFTINASNGALTRIDSDPGGLCGASANAPDSVIAHPLGKYLYLANYNTANAVSAYEINATSGALTTVTGSPFSAGTGTVSVTVDPSGKYAYATNSSSSNNSISQYTIGADGSLSTMTIPTVAAGSNPNSIAIIGGIQ